MKNADDLNAFEITGVTKHKAITGIKPVYTDTEHGTVHQFNR